MTGISSLSVNINLEFNWIEIIQSKVMLPNELKKKNLYASYKKLSPHVEIHTEWKWMVGKRYAKKKEAKSEQV